MRPNQRLNITWKVSCPVKSSICHPIADDSLYGLFKVGQLPRLWLSLVLGYSKKEISLSAYMPKCINAQGSQTNSLLIFTEENWTEWSLPVIVTASVSLKWTDGPVLFFRYCLIVDLEGKISGIMKKKLRI